MGFPLPEIAIRVCAVLPRRYLNLRYKLRPTKFRDRVVAFHIVKHFDAVFAAAT
jgi:hypothetical protein